MNGNLNFIKFTEVEINVIESTMQLLFFHLKQFVTNYAIFTPWFLFLWPLFWFSLKMSKNLQRKTFRVHFAIKSLENRKELLGKILLKTTSLLPMFYIKVDYFYLNQYSTSSLFDKFSFTLICFPKTMKKSTFTFIWKSIFKSEIYDTFTWLLWI